MGNSPEFWASIFAYVFMWGGVGMIVLGLAALAFGIALEWIAA